MGKYSGYNIIPIGDHCAIAMILQQLKLRHTSYPFDWVTNGDQLYGTNIIYNIQLINELNLLDNVDDIVKKYIGDAFIDNRKANSITNICFPHDGDNITENFEKYKRRFIRLKQDLSKKNIFVLLTRHYYIEKDIFQQIIEQLLNYNNESIILFISGTNHKYFEDMKYTNVIFKYIGYDISKFPDYDYTTFRPNVTNILSNLIL
jgi:hypothetical protein